MARQASARGEREAKIHFELHRHLQNAIEKLDAINGVKFERSEPEYTKDLMGSRADIVVFDRENHAWLVIEAKRQMASGQYTRNFDPYSPAVVKQAHSYAQRLGAPFFATYNGRILVLFRTFEEFKPLLERKTKAYEITDIAVFAGELLSDIVRLYNNDIKWDDLDDAFVKRAKNFHDLLTRFYLPSLKDRIRTNSKFNSLFESWVEEQGFDYEKKQEKLDTQEIIAKQGAYILMNQLLFYKILESEEAYNERVEKLEPTKNPEELPSRLAKVFETVVKKVDFKAIFEHDIVFNNVPITEVMATTINEFIEELDDYDLSVLKSEVIGRIYENLIPARERHDLGQYYTPPEIVELITRLSIKSHNDIILDPACGSGGFLVKAYHRLSDLQSKHVRPSHEEILSQINGVDINRFPAHLSAINLAVQDITQRTNNVRIEIADFFRIKHGQTRFARKGVIVDGQGSEEPTPIPNEVDVVVSNPPYIRQEKIVDKEQVRSHLAKIETELEERADIYAYFFTHSYEFLSKKGTIGFITSDKWLDTQYGMQLAAFMLSHFIVKCIIKFDKQVFSDPLIGTVVTILQKEDSETKRNSNQVRLLRLKRSADIDTIEKLATDVRKPETVYDSNTYRLAFKSQVELAAEWKWMRYLYAPQIYFDIMKTNKLTLLTEVAELTRGRVTGANEFFYMTREDAKARGLEFRFLKPIMKAIAQAEFVNFKKEDTEWLCLDLHDTVARIVRELGQEEYLKVSDESAIESVKKEIKKESPSLLKYIESGEEQKFNETPTCKNRRIWFDVGELLRPWLIFPDVYWKRTSVPYNADHIAIDKQLYALVPTFEGNDADFLLGGIMNSDVNALMREMYGRTVGGEGLNRNQVMVWEAEQMPVIDPRQIDPEKAREIVQAFRDLVEKDRDASEERAKSMRRRLNLAVMSALNLGKRTDELETAVKTLIDIRIGGGGQRKDTMVETSGQEAVSVTPLQGARVLGRSPSLDQFFEDE